MKWVIWLIVSFLLMTGCFSNYVAINETTIPRSANSPVADTEDAEIRGPQIKTEAAITINTPRSTATQSGTPAPEDLANLIPYFRNLAIRDSFKVVGLSPNGNWKITSTVANAEVDGNSYGYIRYDFVSADGLTSRRFEEVRSNYWYWPDLFWSASERKTVLADYYSAPDSEFNCSPFSSVSDVHILDLHSGDLTKLSSDPLGSIALSPDARYLASVFPELGKIRIYDLLSGSVKEVKLNIDGVKAAGFPVWSPDSTQIAFSVVTGSCETGTEQAIVQLDVESLSFETVVDFVSRYLFTNSWNENGLLLYESEGLFLEPILWWYFDLHFDHNLRRAFVPTPLPTNMVIQTEIPLVTPNPAIQESIETADLPGGKWRLIRHSIFGPEVSEFASEYSLKVEIESTEGDSRYTLVEINDYHTPGFDGPYFNIVFYSEDGNRLFLFVDRFP